MAPCQTLASRVVQLCPVYALLKCLLLNYKTVQSLEFKHVTVDVWLQEIPISLHLENNTANVPDLHGQVENTSALIVLW